ncbi:hypothetical protein GQX73_g8056 [Xylaria multiplex]|uniref:Uncharacterized protein n=1 Tax=Xylaria multiplex TaxID=323545 RepID=A0A7C8IJV4_9PEZI|nr:hypothetical protein GQX73_g8056 [Xylaria multiplex]
MGDQAVLQSDLEWEVKLPETIKKSHIATVVARIPGRVQPQVIEAVEETKSGTICERFQGDYLHTGPGFNENGTENTYIWFHIGFDHRGKHKIKFRVTWRKGSHLYGAVETYEIKSGDRYEPQDYSPYEVELIWELFNW